jgi:hypothetical protein
MFTPAPTEQELDVAGLTLADLESEGVEVWPENAHAYALFSQLQTQWRIGMAGPTGLDYGVLFHKLDRLGLEPDEYEQLEDDVRTLEHAALMVMSVRG